MILHFYHLEGCPYCIEALTHFLDMMRVKDAGERQGYYNGTRKELRISSRLKVVFHYATQETKERMKKDAGIETFPSFFMESDDGQRRMLGGSSYMINLVNEVTRLRSNIRKTSSTLHVPLRNIL
jgi:glutaredoxin